MGMFHRSFGNNFHCTKNEADLNRKIFLKQYRKAYRESTLADIKKAACVGGFGSGNFYKNIFNFKQPKRYL